MATKRSFYLFLVIYTAAVPVLTVAVWNLFCKGRNPAVLTVERINIVDGEGNLRMVLSNEARQDPGRVDGYTMEERERQAGIIFFNSAGDECGGLVFDGNDSAAGLVLSVDQYRNDQIMQLHYSEDTELKERKYGLMLWEYPTDATFSETYPRTLEILETVEPENILRTLREEGLFAENRLFVGRDDGGEFGLFLYDSKGEPVVKLYVDSDDRPRFEMAE